MSLSTIKFYASANQIQKFKATWEADSQKLDELLEESKLSINEYKTLLAENNLNDNFEFVNVSIDDLAENLEFLPIFNINKNVLYSFVWDSQTPFFSAAVDSIISKFEKLKETLYIENGDSLKAENSRSTKAYSPIKNGQLPYFNRDIDLFKPGQYIHMSNRTKAHLGLLITKPHHEKSIETNALAQWSLENYLDSEKRDKVRKSEKMINLLTNDTIYNRVQAFKVSFYDMLVKILSYPKDSVNGGEYSNIFIFLNPIMSADDFYINAIKTVAQEQCQYVLSKKLFEEAEIRTPKFYVVSLKSSDGYTCSEYFSPTKSTGLKTKNLVIELSFNFNFVIFFKLKLFF